MTRCLVFREEDAEVGIEGEAGGWLPVRVTSSQYRLLLMMARVPGELVTYEAAYTEFDDEDDPVERSTLQYFAREVRSALAKAGLRDVVACVKGRGFRLDVPARCVRIEGC